MITPQSRLLYWTGLVLIPMSLTAAARPDTIFILSLAFSAFVLLVIIDAVASRGFLDGIHVSLPEIARLTKDREGEITLDIENIRETPGRLRLGLAFPVDISSPHEDMTAVLPRNSRRSFISWPCTPKKRGNYVLKNAYLETSSLLGFWAVRKISPARSEIRVYPNTMQEQKNLAAVFLNKGMLGIHAQRQLGKGKEFEKLREYLPGDSYEDIHWKATARRGHPVTKTYQIERTQEVYVVMDASRLSSREVEAPFSPAPLSAETATTTQLERFINAAMVLGLVAEKQRDLFGVLAFSDRVQRFIRAGNGKTHYGVCRDALYSLEPHMVNPDFGEMCSFVRLRLRRRALLVFLTNLDDPVLAENFISNLNVIARHHLILVNMLTDRRVAPLFSRAEASTTDDLYQHLGGHIQWHKLREIKRTLQHRGVSMTLLDSEMMSAQLVSQYINVKRRQLL